MTYYPITIPTLNRYQHFKRCVESLARNTHAEETELVIGLDYPPSDKYFEGYKQIKEYIPTITGFKKVTIFERKENYGPKRNGMELRDYVYQSYDAVIGTEDDNEFSPCFLDFMNKALEKYHDDDRVTQVSGYIGENYSEIVKDNVLFLPTGAGWGLATWRDKVNLIDYNEKYFEDILLSWRKSFKIFRVFPFVLGLLLSMVKQKVWWGDVKWCCINVLNGTFQVRPTKSMVRNWGMDGSGLHCGIDENFSKQDIIKETVFDLDDVEIKMPPQLKSKIFWGDLKKNRILACMQIVLILMEYFKYRLLGK